MLPIKFLLKPTHGWEEMSFEKFQDGGHLWYRNETFLAIPNLYAAPMPPLKFLLNLTYGLGGDVVWRLSRWPPRRPSLISERNNFSNSESLRHYNASHQVLAQSDLRFARCHLKDFKMATIYGGHLRYCNGTILAILNVSLWCFCSIHLTVWEEISFEEFQNGRHGRHLRYRNEMILAILNLVVDPMPPIKFRLNLTYGLGGDVVWRISRWPSWISERKIFSNSESLCHCNVSHQVLAQSDLRFARCHLKNFKMRPSWILERNNLAILNLCVTVMLPIKYWLNTSYGLGENVVWRISRWRHGGYLDIGTEWFYQFWISLSLRCLLSNFSSILLMVWEEMSFEEFQDGRRGGLLGYRNGTILAILNLCVAVMPPIKFWLNPNYGLGGDIVWRISGNDFSNSESLCHCDASHEVSAQSDLRIGRRCRLKNFKMAAMAAILDIGTERF